MRLTSNRRPSSVPERPFSFNRLDELFSTHQHCRMIGSAPVDLHHWLVECLGLDRAGRSPHRLWGAEAEALARMGRDTGWLIDGVPLAFFTGSVLEETARAVAIRNYRLRPTAFDRNEAQSLLTALGLEGLASRAPDQLSDGETKLLWLALQWAKRPRRLFIDSLTVGLSAGTVQRVAGFLAASDHRPALVVGLRSGEVFLRELEGLGQWIDMDAEALFD